MKFYGELLIFVLLLLTNLRVFFVKRVRRDQLVSLSPLSLLISILQIFAWGIDFFTLLAFIISILVFLSNFHALFRYSERLYIDHYSPLMKIWAIFTITLSLIAIAGVLIFAPIELRNEKLNVLESSKKYTGNFRTGFEESKIFSKSNIIVHKFSPNQKSDNPTPNKEIILFIPDKRGETVNYKPYLQLLAKNGYTVFSADFYSDDCKWRHNWQDAKIFRRIFMVIDSVTNNQIFMSQREYYNYNIKQELSVLPSLIKNDCEDFNNYFIISDVMGNIAVEEFAKANSTEVAGIFTLDSIKEYQSAGYGCIEQTDPLLAKYLGLSRDPALFTPELLVIKTKENLGKSENLEISNDIK